MRNIVAATLATSLMLAAAPAMAQVQTDPTPGGAHHVGGDQGGHHGAMQGPPAGTPGATTGRGPDGTMGTDRGPGGTMGHGDRATGGMMGQNAGDHAPGGMMNHADRGPGGMMRHGDRDQGPGGMMRHDDHRDGMMMGHDDHRGGMMTGHDGDRGERHHFARGGRFNPGWAPGYRQVDWRQHHLRRPPHGYHWVWYDNQFMLVAISSGIIASILAGALN